MFQPLPLFHSWPLFDSAARAELGGLALLGAADLLASSLPQTHQAPGVGIWSCDLVTETLSWSAEVQALFGLTGDTAPTRAQALACYAPRSRQAMESLRAHAIKHRRGFTMDARIRRLDGVARWMRLSAMPVLHDGKVVRLVGTKTDITADYDGPEWRDL